LARRAVFWPATRANGIPTRRVGTRKLRYDEALMDIPHFDANRWVERVAKAYAALLSSLSRFQPSPQAPDDFATRPTLPLPEEYEAASNAQLLDRLYRNPAGLLNEQPYIDTLLNARSAENHHKQTRHLVFGFYVLAFAALVLAFKDPPPPPPPPPGQALEQQQKLDGAVGLLKEEFNLKLQGKDLEIKDLKRQIGQLSQGQTDLAKQVKSLAKGAGAAAKPLPVVKPPPPVAEKPKKPN